MTPVWYSKDYKSNSLWSVLQTKFGLTNGQMENIAGANSVMNAFITLYTNALKDELNCAAAPCTPDELLAIQWSGSLASKFPFATVSFDLSFIKSNQ